MSEQFTLQRSQRLKSRKTIAALFASGHGVAIENIRALHLVESHPGGGVQAGFSAPARQFRLAVQRNRVKRLMREAWRLQHMPLRTYFEGRGERLFVFLIYRGKEIPEQETIMLQVAAIINKLEQRYVRQAV